MILIVFELRWQSSAKHVIVAAFGKMPPFHCICPWSKWGAISDWNYLHVGADWRRFHYTPGIQGDMLAFHMFFSVSRLMFISWCTFNDSDYVHNHTLYFILHFIYVIINVLQPLQRLSGFIDKWHFIYPTGTSFMFVIITTDLMIMLCLSSLHKNT